MNPTPEIIPMDGGFTDDVGMMSCPIGFEHGDADGCYNPALQFYIDIQIPGLESLLEDDYDNVQKALDALENKYAQAGPEYWTEFHCIDPAGTDELLYRVEFSGGEYREGETTSDWIDRVVANTNFIKVYNNFILLFNGRDEVWDELGIQGSSA